MTNNQIAYWNLLETKQHNRNVEKYNTDQLAETVRHNRKGEQLGDLQLGETQRSNKAKEKEARRHNQASENIDLSKLAETRRQNTNQYQLGTMQLQETQRHNAMTEYLTQTANLAEKLYKETQNALKSRELDLAEAKELQRISESLRDWEETVRNHDLQALTSSGLRSLINSLGSKFGSSNKTYPVITDPSKLLPGPTVTQSLWSKLKGFGNKIMFINEKIFPEIITPSGESNLGKPMS